jgi:hypothetical protein
MKSLLLFSVLAVVLAAAALLVFPKARSFVADLGYRASQMIFGHMARNGLVLGVFYFPEGSIISVSQTFAAAKTITALTNANPAVATAASHGYSDNDEILLTSGWEDATDSVYRVDQSDANTFSILGLNTSDTDFFAAGAGTGEAMKISSWITVPQVLTINSQGGDARFTNVQLLSRRNAVNVPTGFNPTTITLSLAHDPDDANFQSLQVISRSLTPVAIKVAVGGGAVVYGYGYFTVSELPSMTVNQVNSVTAAMTLLGRSVSYAV